MNVNKISLTPVVFNCLALLIMFPVSIGTFFTIKFWVVTALLAAAVTAAKVGK